MPKNINVLSTSFLFIINDKSCSYIVLDNKIQVVDNERLLITLLIFMILNYYILLIVHHDCSFYECLKFTNINR